MLTIAVIALALLAYVYVGYPVVITLLARLFGRPIRSTREQRPFISVLVPVYNGEACLKDKIDSIFAQTYPADDMELLVYLDGCSDGSRAIAEAAAVGRNNLIVLGSDQRSGKPTALNLMSEHARGDVFVLTDIRQPLSPDAIELLVAALGDPTVACASGNLVLEGGTGAGFYWRYENWIRRCEGRFRSMIGATGPLYAIRRSAFRKLPTDIILDDMWLPMRARLDGHRTVFVEGAIARDAAFGDEREFGRKARTLAGNYQLFARLPRLLLPVVNPSWFETFSHKLLRLLGPWMLIALLLSSTAAAAEGSAVGLSLTLGQGLFYLLAGLGARGGALGRIARSFVMMNLAAVIGLFRFVTQRQRVTW